MWIIVACRLDLRRIGGHNKVACYNALVLFLI